MLQQQATFRVLPPSDILTATVGELSVAAGPEQQYGTVV